MSNVRPFQYTWKQTVNFTLALRTHTARARPCVSVVIKRGNARKQERNSFELECTYEFIFIITIHAICGRYIRLHKYCNPLRMALAKRIDPITSLLLLLLLPWLQLFLFVRLKLHSKKKNVLQIFFSTEIITVFLFIFYLFIYYRKIWVCELFFSFSFFFSFFFYFCFEFQYYIHLWREKKN